MSRVAVIGEWHQAVVLGPCLAALGHDVTGVVGTQEAAEALRSGAPPVHEPGLPELLVACVEAGQLRYTTSFEDALARAEFALIALDTPVGDDDEPETGSVLEAARAIGRAHTGDTIVIVSAQVPVGTCEQVAAEVERAGNGAPAGIAYVPEFLRLGQALRTFREADRFIVGGQAADVRERVAALFEPLGRPIIRMDLRSAEMAKHASNAFLATSISFANELAELCEVVGADVVAVAAAMKLDARIGPHAFLDAGLGFAGGTLGRDVRALQGLGRKHGLPTTLADAVQSVNAGRAALVRRHLERVYDNLAGLTVGMFGLTYKPGTSTLRRSVALEIIDDLASSGVVVRAFDPLAEPAPAGSPPFTRVDDAYAAADDADAVVLVTPWDGIRRLDLREVRSRMRRPVFIDTRNHFDPQLLAHHGFVTFGVGRPGTDHEQKSGVAVVA